MRTSLSSVASSGQANVRKSATDLEAGNNPPADTKSVNEVHISYAQDAPATSSDLPREPGRSNGDTKSLPALNKLPFKRDPPVSRGPHYSTQVDIIGVPAIGGHPEKTWTARATYSPDFPSIVPRPTQVTMALFKMAPMVQAYSAPTDLMSPTRPGGDRTEPPWIIRGIRNRNKEARVLLYDHGEPEEEDTLKTLATRLLKNIEDLRRIEKESRPIFFVCHSTGGLVVKMALAEASRSKNSILGDCYGVTFFSTPHRGSSYLSRPDFSYSISSIMQLSAPLPESISSHLTLDNPLLQKLDSDFKSLATEMQLWTFFETEDTDLSNEFHAPITSIKSALLNLRHEVVYPLLSDHANCANFGSNNQQTKESYLAELSRAIEKALDLAKIKHTEMHLEDRVKVEINGFYEGAFLPSSNEVSMKVWSTTRTLTEFKRHGPAKLLEDRLSEINVPPKEKQYIRQNTRAPDLISDKKKDSGPPGFKSKKFRRGKSKDRSSRELKTTQHLAVPAENDKESEDIVPSMAVMDRDGRLSPDAPTRSASPQDHTVKVVPSVQSLASDTSHYYDLPSEGVSAAPAHTSHGESHTESPSKVQLQPPQRQGSPSRKTQRESGGAMNMTMPMTFSRPDIKKQKLMWVHVPFNNPIWVKDVLSTLSIDKGRDCDSKLLSVEHFESKHIRGRHAEHHACFLKPGCTLIGLDLMSPTVSPRAGRAPGFNPKQAQMCLYLPYMHFDTYKALVKRRILIKRRIKQGRSRPVPQSVAKLDSLELKVTWQYLGHDPPINCRRTLDQFGYPGLLDTRARDDDQMLYKMTKQRFAHLDSAPSLLPHSHIMEKVSSEKSRNEEDEEDNENSDDNSDEDEDEEYEEEESEPEEDEEDIIDGNVLMVDQLWLWIVDSATTVTFFSKKEPLITDGRLFQQADLRNSIFNEVNADLTSKCENSFDFAALAALHAVTVIFERSSHPDLEIFRTFEEAISILTEKMLDSFKQFRARGFRDKTDNHDDFLRAHNIRAKHKEESRLAERQNRENTSALLELRDIEDELHTLEDLFETQKKTIELMISHYERGELRHLTTNGLVFLRQAEDRLEEYANHAEKMIEDVQATREDFDKLLQMVQRQAQVDEVRLQRLQTDLANVQSRSVTIFTVFTVIFLPLTFFTGLFGMNTREWGGGDFLHLKTIGAITLPSSFLIIALALIVAWSTKIRKLFNKIARIGKKVEKAIRKSIMHFIMSIPAAATLASKEARKRNMEDRKEARRLRKEAKKEASWLNEDFWESHVTAREKDYRLPPQNRKSVSLARKKLVDVLREKERRKFGHLGLGKWEDEFMGKIRKEK